MAVASTPARRPEPADDPLDLGPEARVVRAFWQRVADDLRQGRTPCRSPFYRYAGLDAYWFLHQPPAFERWADAAGLLNDRGPVEARAALVRLAWPPDQPTPPAPCPGEGLRDDRRRVA